MRKILIAGIGYIGNYLAEKLSEQGFEVTGICRTPQAAHQTKFGKSIQYIYKDILALEQSELPSDIDVVFYMLSAGERSENAYQKAYVEGVRHLINILPRTVKRIIYVSSTGVYPQKHGEEIDENTPFTPQGFTSQALFQGEQLVLNSGIEPVIVRLGGIYGPGRERLIRMVRDKTATLSKEPIYTNRIHQFDAVGILMHVMHLPHPASLYLGVDCEPAEYNDVLNWLAKQFKVSLAIGEGPSRGSKRILNQKIIESGYTFQFPTFREGYTSMLKSYSA